jgi:glycosyltransferase involved in cell wall biosynthesis
LRIAIVYDCLFPNTVGGAERWYRSLAERLGERHSVTYLTRRQWGEEGPGTGFETIAVSPRSELYHRSARRRIWPPVRFGLGVFWHLLRNGRRYDAVHAASFPYFSVLGARLALRLSRSPARLIVDWHEVWGRDYWRSYLGPVGGRVGFAIERLCVRLPDQSFTFSRLVEGRLREHGHRGPIIRLTGEYAESPLVARLADNASEEPGPPMVVSAGRQIPEKRTQAVPAAVAVARRKVPELRCVIFGDGPESDLTRAQVAELDLDDFVDMPGRADHDQVMQAIAGSSCLLHPSEREGYGLVVVEAASLGTPSIVVEGPENAATELIEEGRNGFVVASADPRTLGEAIVNAIERGEVLRASTLEWYRRNRDRLSIEDSLAKVEVSYAVPEPASGA